MGNKKIRRIIITSIIVFVVILIGFYIFRLTQNDKDRAVIQNYNDIIKNLPEAVRIDFEKSLHTMLIYNNKDKDVSNIKDIVIRSNSNKQTTYKKGQYSGSFIIDIQSIKQSYEVQYKHSDNKDDGFMAGYPTNVLCLDESKLIYGNFDCKDISYWQTTTDPLANKVPYRSDYYTITGVFSDTNTKPIIIIQIMVNNNSTRTRERFIKYKDEALAWLKDQNININDYAVEYRNFSNQTVILDKPEDSGGD